MNYVEVGYPCPECGVEWVKTDDGRDVGYKQMVRAVKKNAAYKTSKCA